MLLANAPSQLPVILTQISDTFVGNSPPLDQTFIGNYYKNYYLQVTIVDAQPSSLIPTDGFPVYLDIAGGAYSPPSPNPSPLTLGPLGKGVASKPYPLDPFLTASTGYIGPYVFRLWVLPLGATPYPNYRYQPTVYFQKLQVQIDVYQGNPDSGGPLLTSLLTDSNLSGDIVLFVLPSYNFSPNHLDQIKLYSDYVKKYLDWSKAVAVDPNDRPTQFVISTYSMVGLQGDPEQLKAEADTLKNLGINAPGIADCTIPVYKGNSGGSEIITDSFWQGLDVSTIESTVDNAKIPWRSGIGQYALLDAYTSAQTLPVPTPPEVQQFFKFYLDTLPSQLLNDWASLALKNLKDSYNGSITKLVGFKLTDESGWGISSYTHNLIDSINNTADPVTGQKTYLPIFQSYLSTLPQVVEGTLKPSNFFPGATAWNDPGIKATGASNSVEYPRLFFWTMRFLTDQAAQGFQAVKEAMKNTFQIPMNIYTNWSDFQGRWYQSNGNSTDTATGVFDWFKTGRLNAHTLCLENVDKSEQRSMQMWSYSGDMLRSAGMLAPGYGTSPPLPGNPGEFGGLMQGSVFDGITHLGGHPAGPAYSILAMFGHGGKFVDLYNYGPDPIGVNPWSSYQAIYKPIADAILLVGRAEKLLYFGRPSRGIVAIYFPGISNLWDDQNSASMCLYLFEVQYLHYALIHGGYTVDFIDDYDIASGALQQRKYTTLYVTGPNVANDKNMISQPLRSHSNSPIPSPQDQIESWVNDGGVLAVTLGGGVADEYNSPTTTFDTILGLHSPRKDPRPFTPFNDQYHSFDMADTMKITDSRFGLNEKMYVSNPIGQLIINTGDPNPAVKAATFSDGTSPAITIHQYGKGYGIAYAFLPGFHYQQSANWDINGQSEPSQGTALPYGWGNIERDLIVAPARIVNTQKPIEISYVDQNGETQDTLIETCLLESDKGIAIVLLNWADTPNHVPITNLKITINNFPDSTIQGNPRPPTIPIDSKISSAQAQDPNSGITVTPLSVASTWQLPFTITLSKLDYVDVIMIDAES